MKRDKHSAGVEMNLSRFCNDEKESRLHERAISMLSKDLKVPEDDVALLYAVVFGKYKESARVKDYLYVFTIRKVKYIFKQRIKLHGTD